MDCKSFLAQRWVHDLEAWEKQSIPEQEGVFGRTKEEFELMTLGEFDALLNGQRKLSGRRRGAPVRAVSMSEWMAKAVEPEAKAS